MGMLNTILKKVGENGEASRPVRLIPGDVISPPPNLQIRLMNDDKQVYPAEYFIIPERLTRHTKEIRINGVVQSCTFYNELQAGDELMLISMQGQEAAKYYIDDRVSQW